MKVVNKILFISLSNIGDAIMTTPALLALHECYPSAVIDIVGDQRSSAVFKHCPFRGEIFNKDKNKVLRGVPALLRSLWFRSYDLIVDIRTDGLAYMLPARKRLTKRNRTNTGPHAVQAHVGIISEVYQGQPLACFVWLSNVEEKFAKEALGQYCGKRLLGIGTGANADVKIWPKENYLSLVEKTGNDFDAIVFLGDSRDKERSNFISSQVKQPCFNLCGMTNILQAVAVQKYLTVFVGNDSGLGHMASAAGVATITIFGTGEPDRYRPWGENAYWLVGEGHKIEQVSVNDVIKQLQNIV